MARSMVFGFASVAGLDMLDTLYFAGMSGLVLDGRPAPCTTASAMTSTAACC